MSASPNMELMPPNPGEDADASYVIIESSNIGDRKTTITHVIGLHYPNWISRLLKRNRKAFFVTNCGLGGKDIPVVLDSGERWLARMLQSEEIEEMSRTGYRYCGVYHSSSKRPVLSRLVIHEAKET